MNRTMELEKLRNEVSAAVGGRRVSDAEVETFQERMDYIIDETAGDHRAETADNDRKGLIEELAQSIRVHRVNFVAADERHAAAFAGAARSRRPRRSHESAAMVRLSQEELRKAREFTRRIGLLVGADPSVASLRKRLFAGRRVSLAGAQQLMRSPAPGYCTPDFFTHYGIPLVGHTSEFVKLGNGVPRGIEEGNDLAIRWGGKRRVVEVTGGSIRIAWSEDEPILAVRLEGRVHKARCIGLTVFREIRDVAVKLVESFPWDEEDAAAFLVTGTPPPIHPLRVEFQKWQVKAGFENVFLSLRVQPWVSVETVSRTIRHLRRRLVTPTGRPPSQRAREVVEFVNSRTEPDGKRPAWPALQDSWNKTHPKMKFHAWRSMRMAYSRAKDYLPAASLMRPGYFERLRANGGVQE